MNINSSRYQDSCGFSDDDNDAAPEKRSRQWVGILIALGLSVLFFFLVFYGPRQTVLNAFLYNCTLRIIFGLAVLRIARKLYGRLVPEILSSRENGPALIAGAGAVLYTLYHLFCVFALLSAPGASFSGLTSELIFIDLFLLQITTGFYLYALHYLKDVEAVEDVVQDCFVRLMECEDKPHNIRAWLYTAVRNRCIDQLRRVNPIESDIQPEDLDGQISDDEAQERSVHEARLWTAIDELPKRCREILLLSKRDGLTYHEIAQRLGLSEKTVEHQVSKALKRLRGSTFASLLA